MQQPSRSIISNQQMMHPDLDDVIQKHLVSVYQKPILAFNQSAFKTADKMYQQYQGNFILDSGCGVGESTYQIAKKFPDAFVLGIDQSKYRIDTNSEWTLPENALLLRADLVDFWRLAAEADWQLARHYLLYPNPWPKKKHLQRRWHGHPVFLALKELGGKIELRTNWKIYAEEFSHALNILMEKNYQMEIFVPEKPITPFERKYQLSGQELYRVSKIT
ncbi:MAG: SAM-dependent methyltransferase [Gammaproteobacteria bacterium]|nr:SAM-dependent methyltransferase [Gammaproteobacteria bacterium]